MLTNLLAGETFGQRSVGALPDESRPHQPAAGLRTELHRGHAQLCRGHARIPVTNGVVIAASGGIAHPGGGDHQTPVTSGKAIALVELNRAGAALRAELGLAVVRSARAATIGKWSAHLRGLNRGG